MFTLSPANIPVMAVSIFGIFLCITQILLSPLRGITISGRFTELTILPFSM